MITYYQLLPKDSIFLSSEHRLCCKHSSSKLLMDYLVQRISLQYRSLGSGTRSRTQKIFGPSPARAVTSTIHSTSFAVLPSTFSVHRRPRRCFSHEPTSRSLKTGRKELNSMSTLTTKLSMGGVWTRWFYRAVVLRHVKNEKRHPEY